MAGNDILPVVIVLVHAFAFFLSNNSEYLPIIENCAPVAQLLKCSFVKSEIAGFMTNDAHLALVMAKRTEDLMTVRKELLNGNNGDKLSARGIENSLVNDSGSLRTPKLVRRMHNIIDENPVNTQKNKSVFGFSPTTTVKKPIKEIMGGYVRADPTEVPTTVMRTKFPPTVMVISVISSERGAHHMTPPFFFHRVANGGRPYVFQQDSDPFHKALKAKGWMAGNLYHHGDADFRRILANVDPSGSGFVTYDSFMRFMTQQASDSESAEQLIDSFRVLANEQKYVAHSANLINEEYVYELRDSGGGSKRLQIHANRNYNWLSSYLKDVEIIGVLVFYMKQKLLSKQQGDVFERREQ
ncbi:hypothetical protein ACTXT7_011636 [Hymenolepis weldensis]